MPNAIDVYATAYGSAPANAVDRSAAHLGYETSRGRPPENIDVEFCDYNFRDETDFEEHLRIVEQEQPKLAVAPDVQDAADLDAAIQQADRLNVHADTVIMVPKGVHPTEIPDRFRVGLPLANWDMGNDADVDEFYDTRGKPQFHPWTAYQDVGEVHLLGGGPMLQLEVSKYSIPIESVDGASVLKAAQRGGLFTPEKWLKTTADCPPLYEKIEHSLNNLVRAWAERYDYQPVIDAEPYTADECAEEIAEAKRKAREKVEQEREYRRNRGPAFIEAGDEDLWDPEEEATPEVVDWEDRLNEAEEQAVRAARHELEKIADGGVSQPELGAFTPDASGEDTDAGASEPAKSDKPGMSDYLDKLGKQALEVDRSKRRDPEMFYVKTTLGPQPWLDGENILISAGTAWRNPGGDGFTLDPPDEHGELFVDSGGYQAAVHFRDEFPYSPEELFEYAERVGADYCAAMDWACESAEQLAAIYEGIEAEQIAPIADRIEWSIRDQKRCLEVYQDGDWDFELVGVVQGYDPEDYRYAARRLREIGLASEYMAIGTVCKRTTVKGISDVLDVCREELPATEFHLFGATKSVWNDRSFRKRFRSADTHAWAMKTPEGEWTMTNEDKERAFEAYRDDIEAAQERWKTQSTFDADAADRQLAHSLISVGARICVCGTLIPAYYDDDFDPGCRFCANTMMNRWDAALAAEEELIEEGYEPSDETPETTETTLPTDTESDEDDEMAYDPTDDMDDDADSPTPKHFGDYRREKVERLDETPHLEPIETFDSVDEMAEAIEEIHVPGYSSPPEKTIDKLRHYFGRLPNEEAERNYLNDYKLTRTVNAARRAFNEWVGRKKRYDQIPGWAEAGPSNYPVRKQQKARDSAHNARETLDEKLDRLNGRTKGAFRRALKKAGFSEAELNEQKREAEREKGREKYEKGDIVIFKNYTRPWSIYGVKRVNKKSLTLSKPHPEAGVTPEWGNQGEPYPDYTTGNAKLDKPDMLKGPIPPEEWEDLEERHGYPADYREAQIELFGEDWVNRHLSEPSDDTDTDSDDTMSNENLADELKERGVPAQGANAIAAEYGTLDDAFNATYSTIEDLKGVGPSTLDAYSKAKQAYQNRDDEPDHTDERDAWDPRHLFSDDVEFAFEIEWQDVEHPENVPKTEKETEIDLAKRILMAGGNRTGFSHHEEVRSSMLKWVNEHEDDDSNPGYWSEMHYKMGPHERSSGRFDSDDIDPDEHPQRALNRKYKKARTVIAWASDNIDHDVLREIEDEQAAAAAKAFREAGEEQVTERLDAEFEQDPPAELNGWQKWDDHGKDDVVLAYRAMSHRIPSVAAIYETDDGLDAGEYALSDWFTSKPASEIGKNSVVLIRGERTVYGELRSHLERSDPHDPIPENINGWERYPDEWWTYTGPENTVWVTIESAGKIECNVLVESDWGTVERVESGVFEKDGVDAAIEYMKSHNPGDVAIEAEHEDAADESEPSEKEEAQASAEDLADEFYGWSLTGNGGDYSHEFKHRMGQRVVVKKDHQDDGWHADLNNPDWPDHTKWLTDPDARDQQPGRGSGDRKREAVSMKDAFSAAYDEMARIYRENEKDDYQAFGEGQEPPLEIEDPEAAAEEGNGGDGGGSDETEWADTRDEEAKMQGLGAFGVEAKEGTGSASEEHRRAQNQGYLLSGSEPSSVENEREGLGAFGARPSSTKGLEEFEQPDEEEEEQADDLPEEVGDWSLARADDEWVIYEMPYEGYKGRTHQARISTGGAGYYVNHSIKGQGDTSRTVVANIGEHIYGDREDAIDALLAYLRGEEPADESEGDGWDAEAVAAEALERAEAKREALYEVTAEDAFGPAFSGYSKQELARVSGISASDWDGLHPHDERERPWVDEAEAEMFAAFTDRDRDEENERILADIYGEREAQQAADEAAAREQAEPPEPETPTVSGQAEFETEDEATDTETIAVEFGSRADANAHRDELPDGSRTGKYDGRYKTVEVYAGALSESEIEQLHAAALDSKRVESKYGHSDLTDNERRQLDKRDGWTWGTHGFHATASKAILQEHGVSDWISKYDHTFDDPKEHLSVVPQAGDTPQEMLGIGSQGGDVYEIEEDAPQVVERRGKQAAKAHSEECNNAIEWCGKGDEGACIHLASECGWSDEEIEEMRADVMEMETRMDALTVGDGGPIEEEEPAIEPETVVMAGDTEELPPFALRTLQRAWNGFRAAAIEAEEAREAVERYENARREAREYGAIVNEVREQFGQQPIDIEATVTVTTEDGSQTEQKVRLSDLPELERVEWGGTGDTSPTIETVGSVAADFYDPFMDMSDGDDDGMPAPSTPALKDPGFPEGWDDMTDAEKAEYVHERRSPEAQELDESIQAHEQTTLFDKWKEAPNMMDFVGVDDQSMMGLEGLD